MADTFTAVDLSQLPPPAVLAPLDFETIYQELLADLRAELPDFDATVESDPVVKLLQLFAYRILMLRGQFNDAVRAVMIPYAGGGDLDNLAAVFGVQRQQLTPGDPEQNIPPTYESDADLRRRVLLAPEGYSVAGPEGAYIYHALSADPDVLDASATSPTPGAVLVTILSRTGTGAASAALVQKVSAYLTDESRRPLTDFVTVQGAQIVNYAVRARLTTFSGPDSAIVLAEANTRLDAYCAACHRLGLDVTLSGLHAALHAPGVQNVELLEPAANIVISRTQTSWRTGKDITHAGIGE